MCESCSDVVSVSKSSSPPLCGFSVSFFSASLLAVFVSLLGFKSLLLALWDNFDLCWSFSFLTCLDFCPSRFEADVGFASSLDWLSCFPTVLVPSSDAFAPSWDWTACLETGLTGVVGVSGCSSDGAIVCTERAMHSSSQSYYAILRNLYSPSIAPQCTCMYTSIVSASVSRSLYNVT